MAKLWKKAAVNKMVYKVDTRHWSLSNQPRQYPFSATSQHLQQSNQNLKYVFAALSLRNRGAVAKKTRRRIILVFRERDKDPTGRMINELSAICGLQRSPYLAKVTIIPQKNNSLKKTFICIGYTSARTKYLWTCVNPWILQ